MEKITIGSKQYEIVEEIGEWDYDWYIGAALRDGAGQWFWVADSGCSCTSFGDNIGESDLVACKSPHDVVAEAQKDGQFSDSAIHSFLNRLLY